MNGLAIAGGIGQGITAGVQDLRAQKEADQLSKLREMQIKQAQQDQEFQDALKTVGTAPTAYKTALAQQGIGAQQAAALEAQTKDFGPQGLQATMSATLPGSAVAAPPASAEAARTKQLADLALQYGKLDQYGALSERAYTLGQREYQDAVRQLVALGPTMSPEDYARSAASLFSSNATPYKAFVTPGAGGQLNGTIFDDKGRAVSMPVSTHDQISQMLMSSTSPEAWQRSQEMALKQAGLGIQGRQAGAAETAAGASMMKAQTDARELANKELSGFFTAQTNKLKADSTLAYGQTEQAKAHAEYFRSQTKLQDAKVNDLETKLGGAEKEFLNILRANLAGTMKYATENDSPQAQDAVRAAKFNLSEFYNQYGVGMDSYSFSGVPSPAIAAKNLLKGKAKPEDIQKQIGGLSTSLGFKYANDVQQAVATEQAKAAPKKTIAPANIVSQPQGPVNTTEIPNDAEAVGQRIDDIKSRLSYLDKSAPGVADKSGRAKYLANKEALQSELQSLQTQYSPAIKPAFGLQRP